MSPGQTPVPEPRDLDLNCDMGEGYGPFSFGNDAALMAQVSSVNLACGAHGGDPVTLVRTVDLALEHRLSIGAHPSFPDLAGFGRREMVLSSKEIYALILHQVSSVLGVVQARRGTLRHVKPHGALYHALERSERASVAFSRAIHDLNPALRVYALSGGKLAQVASGFGLGVMHEVFADRRYLSGGKLALRGQPGAVLETLDAALEHTLPLLERGQVTTLEGELLSLRADTLCIHGDSPIALELARALREALPARGIRLRAPR